MIEREINECAGGFVYHDPMWRRWGLGLELLPNKVPAQRKKRG
jgi:hypothetical protein